MVKLTTHQQQAVARTVAAVKRGARVTAIRGLAGTGKSTLIPELRARLAARPTDR